MTLENTIRRTDHLTPVEAELGAYILNNLEHIPSMSILELACNTNVSKSAVHRFCKKIGFDGFNDLKVAAARDLAEIRSSSELIDVNYPFGETDGPQPIAQKLARLYETAIADTYRHIDFIQVQRVARMLNRAGGNLYPQYVTHAFSISSREKLEIVGALAQRIWDASPYNVKVHLTLDRREALKDADFVTTQFRVGLLDARIKDERIPLSHGMLGQEIPEEIIRNCEILTVNQTFPKRFLQNRGGCRRFIALRPPLAFFFCGPHCKTAAGSSSIKRCILSSKESCAVQLKGTPTT